MKKIISIAILTSFLTLNISPVLAVENSTTPKQFKSIDQKNKKVSDDYKFAYINMDWWNNFGDDILNEYIQN